MSPEIKNKADATPSVTNSHKTYTLIITEKPDAAKRIAEALDSQGTPKKLTENGVPYFVAQRDRQLVIVPAIGHLYTIIGKGQTQHLSCLQFQVGATPSGRKKSKKYSVLGRNVS